MSERLMMAVAAGALVAMTLPGVAAAAQPDPTLGADGSVIPADRGVFSPTASPPPGYWRGSATTLHDGRVLVIGDTTRKAAALLWDPTTGQFTETGSTPMWGVAFKATTLLDDGRVLIKGSYGDGRRAAVWDPATGTFTETGSLSVLRGGGRATLLDDGRVFVIGGTADSGPTAELWDPGTGTFTPLDAVSRLEVAQALVALDGGRVLVIGPECYERGCSFGAEIWDIAAASVAPAGAPTRRQNPRTGDGVTAATPLLDGRILVTTDEGGGRARAFTWDPTSGSFTPAGRLHHAGDGFSVTRLLDGRVLIAGGADRSRDANDEAEIWDPATGDFSPTGSMGASRVGALATLLQDGRVLVAGGFDQEGDATGTSGPLLSSAEVFELVP